MFPSLTVKEIQSYQRKIKEYCKSNIFTVVVYVFIDCRLRNEAKESNYLPRFVFQYRNMIRVRIRHPPLLSVTRVCSIDIVDLPPARPAV